MLLVYTPRITHRCRYIFQVMMNDLLGLKTEFTEDPGAFRDFQGAKLSYCRQPVSDELNIAPAGLLFERGIEGQEISFIDFGRSKAFYPTFSRHSALPFDPFAASFFLVSRYEEYLPFVLDRFDRFDVTTSISYSKGFLDKPVVNLWAAMIGDMLGERYPGLQVRPPKYSFIPTVDIDSAWKYRAKGFVRSVGGFMEALSKGDSRDIRRRIRVLAGAERDPLDTYGEQLETFSHYGLRPLYFILFADYGLNDKNIDPDSRSFQELVKFLSDYAEIGLHNSYHSSFDQVVLEKELLRLSLVLNKNITRSRQHFIRLNLPYMYRNLIELDILEDYSMGYNSLPGFRAGIANPFPFYDLDRESPTKLKIYPFIFGVNKFHPVNSQQRLDSILQVIREARKVNGTLVGMWDNEVMGAHQDPQWRSHLNTILQEAVG
jgi:hypothetical protein